MEENFVMEDGDVVVYPDRKKALRRLNMRAALVLLPVALALFPMFGFMKSHLRAPIAPFLGLELDFLPWFVLMFYACLYVAMLISLGRRNRPIVRMSPEGLTIHTTATQLGLVRWDEIADVKTYNFIYRYLGIVPRDTAALCRRLGRPSLMIRLYSWCVPLYRFFGVYVAQINIPQEYLPVTADELAERIRSYYSTLPAASSSHTETGIWPPQPADGSFYRAR